MCINSSFYSLFDTYLHSKETGLQNNVLILSKDEVYIDQSGNVHIDQSGNGYIDQSGNGYIDQSGNIDIDQSGNTKLDFKVLIYQDIYRPEHLSSKYIKTFIVFIIKT
jgi:hypothetical protein